MNQLRACALTRLISAFAVSGALYFHAPFSFLVASMITSSFAARKAGLFVIALSALAFYLLFLESGKRPAITADAVARPALFIGPMLCVTERIHVKRFQDAV